MSDVISFKYNGNKDGYLSWKHSLEKDGLTVQDKLSSVINQEITLSKDESESNNKTASRHEDDLKSNLMKLDLSRVIIDRIFHVVISDIDFIQTAKHELETRVTNAIHNAVFGYWASIWATKRAYTFE